ncbi:biosynthetic peptidoglycan transglycosylase [Desulfosporosinus sp. PR]|uniref:biosynthetic peptidoglycan transglycosylase n=1 Tax=Candidatus Desulfosporosinus nitrosoreducens TaxID=3401928 RepID=UPI0028000DD5|nr:biosynthetic peptidoglycan transglycosylase [Desulfosporosinus sp. PR]MDQ7092259.1 biosynthetic peptidoglycan transglycosylase [Desulfosporosinus sp. PR]
MKRSVKFLILMVITLYIGWFGMKYYFTHMNRIADLVRNDVAAQIHSHNSRFLKYNEIPVLYRNAVVATEDRSFFTNRGIDFTGTLRAVFVDVASGQSRQGGSTITQQLVHNTLLSKETKSLLWKIEETFYAIGLYDTMNKQETFELYANIIYFGHGAQGLYQASQTYFEKSPSELNAGELAMLAGLPNAPGVYDPYKNLTLARERQDLVVQSMVNDGVINEFQAEQVMKQPIMLK